MNYKCLEFKILIATIICLRLLGRTWWAKSGTLIPWCFEVASENNSQTLLDPYTFSHILHGIIFFWFLIWLLPKWNNKSRFIISLVLEAFWEIIENTPFIINRYRAINISLGYFGDSILNSTSDIMACVCGYIIAQRLGIKWSIIIYLAVEIIMLYTIKDSLFLNVIMLIYPFQFLQVWQNQ